MWNINEGMTEKGVAFLNESKTPLTDKSDDAAIERAFRKELRLHIDSIMSCVLSGSAPCVQLNTIIKSIEKDTGKKLSSTNIKNWLKEEITTASNKKISKLKF